MLINKENHIPRERNLYFYTILKCVYYFTDLFSIFKAFTTFKNNILHTDVHTNRFFL